MDIPVLGTWLAGLAGAREGKQWRGILESTQEGIAELTGKGLYEHARSEAGRWAVSAHPGYYHWLNHTQEAHAPWTIFHDECLAYTSAFIACFPQEYITPVSGMYLKDGE